MLTHTQPHVNNDTSRTFRASGLRSSDTQEELVSFVKATGSVALAASAGRQPEQRLSVCLWAEGSLKEGRQRNGRTYVCCVRSPGQRLTDSRSLAAARTRTLSNKDRDKMWWCLVCRLERNKFPAGMADGTLETCTFNLSRAAGKHFPSHYSSRDPEAARAPGSCFKETPRLLMYY